MSPLACAFACLRDDVQSLSHGEYRVCDSARRSRFDARLDDARILAVAPVDADEHRHLGDCLPVATMKQHVTFRNGVDRTEPDGRDVVGPADNSRVRAKTRQSPGCGAVLEPN